MSEISIDCVEGLMSVYVVGEIDHHWAKKLKDVLDPQIINYSPEICVLDFSGVTFMDSSGVGFILGRHKLVDSFGGKLIVQGTPPGVSKMLTIAGVSKVCELTKGRI